MKRKKNKKKRKSNIIIKQKNRQSKILRNKKKRKRKKSRFYVRLKRNIARMEDRLRKEFNGYTFIKAPKIFSLLKNEEEVIEFQHQLKKCLQDRKKVLVRLEDVTELSTEAILLLLTIMVEYKSA